MFLGRSRQDFHTSSKLFPICCLSCFVPTFAPQAFQTYVFVVLLRPKRSRPSYFAILFAILRHKPSRPTYFVLLLHPKPSDSRILSYFCAPSLPDLRILAYLCAPHIQDTEKALKSTSGRPPGKRVLKRRKGVLEAFFGRSWGGPQEGTKIQRL